LRDGVEALSRVPGFVFTSSDLHLEAGRYRLKMGFDRASFVNAVTNSASSGHAFPSGLVVEVLHGSSAIGLRPVAVDELARGSLAVEFHIPRKMLGGSEATEFRLFSSGKIGLTISNASVEPVSHPEAAADIAAFNYVPMLAVGPAGVRGPGVKGRGRAIHAKPGVAGWVAHCGDNHAQHRRQRRAYDGLYNCMWLPPGRYEALFELDVHEVKPGSAIGMYILAEQGSTVFAKRFVEPHRSGTLVSPLVFEIGERIPVREDGLLEFLLWTGGRAEFSLTGLRIREAPPDAQPHSALQVDRSGLLAELSTAEAGTRLPGAIVALTGVAGYVFSGPAVEVAPGTHRFTLVVGSARFTQSSTNETGLALEVFQGTLLLAYHEVSREELQRGEISIDVRVSGAAGQERAEVEFRLWSIGVAEVELTEARVEETGAASATDVAEFDAALLSSAGPAGERRPDPISRRIGIHAKPGIEGNVSHGPYVWLPAGRYEARFVFHVKRGPENEAVTFDVVSNLGSNVLAQGRFAAKKGRLLERVIGSRWEPLEGTLAFDIPAAVPPGDNGRLEFRTWSTGALEFFLVALHVKRLQRVPSGER
jgi:hypothetical protein